MKQIAAVIDLNLGRLLQRPGLALVNVLGVACVAGVMISLLAVGQGVSKMTAANVDPAQVMVLSAAAGTEYIGAIPTSAVAIVADAPGVRFDAAGHPMLQPQALVAVELTKKGDGGVSTVPFRGSGPEGWAMNSAIHLTAGRMYRPGVHELVVGRGLQTQFVNLGVGDTVELGGAPWSVVGSFEDGGGIGENSLVSDENTVLSAFGRDAAQSIRVQLRSPAAFGAFKSALEANPQLSVKVQFYADYMRDQTQQVFSILNFIGYFIAAVMAVGAIFGALTTMYAAVETRQREYATLLALGFGRFSILVGIVVESLVIALPGLALGALASWLLFREHRTAIQGFSFVLAFNPGLVVASGVFTVLIGLVGGFAPAVRAARLPVAAALRAT